MSCCDDFVWICCPFEWFGVVVIVLGDETVDCSLKVDEGTEDTSFQPPPRQFGEEAFHSVEPATGCRGKVEGPTRVPGQPGADFFMLVGRIIVDNGVDGLVCRNIALDAVEKSDELLVAMALHVLPDDGCIQNVQRRKQGGCAVALVIMGHGCPASLLHWQAGLRAIKRLNLGRFIDRKHDRVGGRRDIQADNISELLKQGRIVGELELPPAMRAETVRLPNSLHRKSRHTGCLGHRTQRPMRCFMGWWGLCQPHNLGHAISRDRRDTGRAGLVAKQAIDALRHEPRLPTPDASLRLAGRSPDRHRTQPIIAQQNDTSTPDMFLQASGSGQQSRVIASDQPKIP